MAAYGTDPAKYLPPHTSQLATRLSADGVDDCLVASIFALVNGASLGEATRTPRGHEPTTAAIVRTAVRMRDQLDDPDTTAGEQQTVPSRLGGGSDGGAHVAGVSDAPDRRHRLQGARRPPPRRAHRRAGGQPLPHRRAVTVEAGRRRRPRHRTLTCTGPKGRARVSSSTTRTARVASTCAASGYRGSRCASSPSAIPTARSPPCGSSAMAPGRPSGSWPARWTAASVASRSRRQRPRGRPSGPSSACGLASGSSRPVARSTALRPWLRRSMPNGSPSATSSRRGGGVNAIGDLLAWVQRGLQRAGHVISLRVREEPVLTVGLFRAAVTMLVGFGLGWSGEQVALMVAFIEAVIGLGRPSRGNADNQTFATRRTGRAVARREGGNGRQGLTAVGRCATCVGKPRSRPRTRWRQEWRCCGRLRRATQPGGWWATSAPLTGKNT